MQFGAVPICVSHILEVIYASNSKGRSGGEGDLKCKAWLYTSAVHLGTDEFCLGQSWLSTLFNAATSKKSLNIFDKANNEIQLFLIN